MEFSLVLASLVPCYPVQRQMHIDGV
jgi:hypothetical protein